MFSWKEFERTQSLLSQDGSYRMLATQHHITVRPSNLLRWLEMLAEDLGFFTLIEIAGADKRGVEGSTYRFELTYHLLNMGNHQRLNLHVVFNESELIPTVSKIFFHADLMEREQQESLGIHFDREASALLLPSQKPEGLPVIRKNPNKSEAPYPEEAFVWKKYDLFSAPTLGLFEWMLCFDTNKVVDSRVNIGFHHQGFEKLLEGKDWQQVLQLVDKIHLGAAPSYSVACARNVEDLLRIKLPERAQAIRMIVLELARIAEHLTVMQEITFALQIDEHRLFINAREKVYELIEKYCGSRVGLGIVRFGGVREDLPHGWNVEYQGVYEIVTRSIRIIHHSLLSQSRFRDSLTGSEVSAQTALTWGIGGPAMRACGLNFDLRKSQPFYFYRDVDFDIPVGIHGTAFERYLVRYEEIFQSFRIITQVVDNLPLGEVMNKDYDLDYVALKDYFNSQEFPKAWHYSGLESPNGEAGFLVLFNNRTSPDRIKIKSPSFILAQALPEFIRGVDEGHLKAALASLGMRQTELDR